MAAISFLAVGQWRGMETLQSMAENADIQTMMNVYVHPDGVSIREAGNAMDVILHEYVSSLA